MSDARKELTSNENIAIKMLENKEFCFSIVKCKNRNEVKKFLALNGINATDDDIDDLAENISEVADICKRLDDNQLSNIVGGANAGDVAKKALAGVGIAAMVAGGVELLLLFAAGIKKVGDEKGWWNKDKKKKS